jgi:hypothetical protein
VSAPRPRTGAQRKADSLDLLRRDAVDVWVATASVEDATPWPHLVPVSLAWLDDDRAAIAIQARSRTARDLRAQPAARLAVGPTRDVVMIDAVAEEEHDVAEAPADLVRQYLRQADWDPRASSGYVFFVLRPHRIQAWREADEIPGRTLMRDGRWLVD